MSKGAKALKMEMTEEGILITGDNLEELTVIGNNSEEKVELNINTEQNKVLIKANNAKNKLVAYIDSDNDGTYETAIGESTESDTKETNAKTDDENKSTKADGNNVLDKTNEKTN